ncbi:MAG TPA: GNAT family N-acetyltransferase [Symbiobacteriaceae bacterium]|nr:GNAT family N-acetyltransferase [Symbiobacteriaceae bacterium]
MDLVIRRAVSDDVEALALLYVAFHNFHARGVPSRLQPVAGVDDRLRDAVRAILADDQAAVFVACVDGAVTGFAEVYRQEAKADPAVVSRTYGHLQSLMVAEPARRQGLGARLMEAVHQWAGENGLPELELDIWEFDEGPLEFYQSLGYTTMRRQLVAKL